MRKIVAAGAGELAAAILTRLAATNPGELVVLDGDRSRADANALDVATAAATGVRHSRARGTDDWHDASGCEVLVLADGDMTALRDAATRAAEHCPDAVLVVAAEPAETMTHLVTFTTLFPRQRVVGSGPAASSARFRALIAAELGTSPADVWALVVGEQGETMVPLASSATVAGRPAADRLGPERLEEVVRRVRAGAGGEDIHARAAAAAEVVDAIVGDQRRVLCCAALCEGELGLDRVCLGVPVCLGQGGVQEIVEVPLSDGERAALERSAAVVRERVAALLGEG
jgi:malate dehydrogenase